MENPNERKAAWPAVYFIREDLKNEKASLVEDMRELSLHYWGGSDPVMDVLLKDISDRINEINDIIRNVTLNLYEIEPEE